MKQVMVLRLKNSGIEQIYEDTIWTEMPCCCNIHLDET